MSDRRLAQLPGPWRQHHGTGTRDDYKMAAREFISGFSLFYFVFFSSFSWFLSVSLQSVWNLQTWALAQMSPTPFPRAWDTA